MKILFHIIRPPTGADVRIQAAHHVWLSVALTGLGCCVGLLTVVFSAFVYKPREAAMLLLESFLQKPLLLAMSCLAPVLLIWLFYFLFGRAWAGYLGCAIPIGAIMVANYYKIRLRTDPLLATDLRLVFEAGDIAGGYDLAPGRLLPMVLLCLAAGLIFSIVLLPRGVRGRRPRLFGTAVCLALIGVALTGPYSSEDVYQRIDNELINPWSPTELYLSKGCVYSFLHSGKDFFPTPPPGYQKAQAVELLAEYPDSDIPEEKKVSIMGFMLEGFCDLTDFEVLGAQESVVQLYAPWHELEAQSVSGDLLTNIFAGGTVDTEWGFLTGYSTHEEFRGPTDSYVWYLRDQGYQAFGSHPGQEWFYNRQNVNRYLGFQDYRFIESYFSPYLTLEGAVRDSDPLLVEEDLKTLKERIKDGPCFSFSVTYQNHGPYESLYSEGEPYLTSAGVGLSEESCNILNNYMDGLSRTIGTFTALAQELEGMDEPVVLVLFGDHKPWAGNGGSVYYEMGLTFDVSTSRGFYDYYSTPYLIWANPAAKETLGRNFTGDGGDFSPCFLMGEVFNQCGWVGPGFMELSRQMRAVTPLVHETGLFWADGGPTDALNGADDEFYRRFLYAQYYREQAGLE